MQMMLEAETRNNLSCALQPIVKRPIFPFRSLNSGAAPLLSLVSSRVCRRSVRTSSQPPHLRSETLDRQAAAVDMGQIQYSEKYFDDTFEYRHVVLPPEVAKLLPKNRLLAENEWRALGVQQSRGWVHYAVHRPEPHIMLFRRPLNYQQQQDAAAAAAALMMPK
ncbi:hypothetical protein ZWY2020_034961 [Hordeum vulgare]|nr:hypothetical protein ZWY2020_034961 [Hordeum vulgare]